MERQAKLQKLNHFRRQLPHMSASALAAVLDAVNEDDMPEVWDRDSMREARNMQCKTSGPYGPILQYVNVVSKTGGDVQIPIANPFAMLHACMTYSRGLQTFVARLILQTPSSPEEPWRLLIYSDEVTPCNVLSTNNRRKFQAVYFSF